MYTKLNTPKITQKNMPNIVPLTTTNIYLNISELLKQCKIVIIEGNVGVGKTTALSHLSRNNSNINVIDEGIDNFTKLDDINPLEQFYNGTINAFDFQTYINICLSNGILTKLRVDKLNILVRSPISAVKCFSALALTNGLITENQYKIHCMFLKTFEDLFDIKNILQIYLLATPQLCFQRSTLRNRSEEKKLTLDYLIDLNTKYMCYVSEYKPYGIDAQRSDINKIVNEIAFLINDKFKTNIKTSINLFKPLTSEDIIQINNTSIVDEQSL